MPDNNFHIHDKHILQVVQVFHCYYDLPTHSIRLPKTFSIVIIYLFIYLFVLYFMLTFTVKSIKHSDLYNSLYTNSYTNGIQ